MRSTSTIGSAVEAVAGAARPVVGAAGDYDALIDLVGTRRFVLIGEASHGTHDFYRERARITRRLIDECGFTVVAVEADWPDAYWNFKFASASSSLVRLFRAESARLRPWFHSLVMRKDPCGSRGVILFSGFVL